VASFLAAAHLDPFDLIASLRTRIGLFKDDGGGTLACPVRRPRDDGKFTIPPYAAAASALGATSRLVNGRLPSRTIETQ